MKRKQNIQIIQKVIHPEVASKFDGGKERYDLIPHHSLNEVVKVFTYGMNKYGKNDWRKGSEFGRWFGAMMRHLWKWWGGESIDDESGLSHLAHAVANAMMLMEFERRGDGDDDRIIDGIASIIKNSENQQVSYLVQFPLGKITKFDTFGEADKFNISKCDGKAQIVLKIGKITEELRSGLC